MTYLYCFLASVFSILVLFIITKLIGYRQISQMNLFDYTNGITIGSIAASLAISSSKDFLKPLIAMIVYGAATLGIAIFSGRSVIFRDLVNGKPLILFHSGKLIRKNFKHSHIDLNEFLMQCRTNGYFDLSQLDTVILETNGRLSFLPKTEEKPMTPSEAGIAVAQETMSVSLIIDGQMISENIQELGYDEIWLKKKLGNTKVSEVFLAVGNKKGDLQVYKIL